MVGEEMNLVELKGYNHTKDHLDKNRSSMLEESVISLESQLLQYRREHNIFEVGDKVVLLNWDNNNRLLTIKRIYEHELYKNDEYLYSTFIYYVKEWSHDHAFSKRDIRHATDAEIEAGKRL